MKVPALVPTLTNSKLVRHVVRVCFQWKPTKGETANRTARCLGRQLFPVQKPHKLQYKTGPREYSSTDFGEVFVNFVSALYGINLTTDSGTIYRGACW